MNLNSYQKIYFVGIGGIGMSALARWFFAYNYSVAGYDRTATELTDQLAEEGMDIVFEDNINAISNNFKDKNVLVIYTPAIPADSEILNFYKSNGNNILKRSDVLGLITKNSYTIAIAGTHGKTTTSSMVTHVLKNAGINLSAFLGGITQNYNTNLILPDKSNQTSIVVVEADEYDRSFLKLNPDIAIITTMDPDHLDIYRDEEDFTNTFFQFVDKTANDGCLIYKSELALEKLPNPTLKYSFGINNAYFKAENIRIEHQKFVFDLVENQKFVQQIIISVPGVHNILNALAAIAVGKSLGIDYKLIAEGIASFKGVKRRFEYIYQNLNLVYIDDYAHHPTELNAFIDAIRALYPTKKLTLIFQPHLYSRTRDFMDDFAQCLSRVDELVLLDIYPARELPIEGVDSQVLLSKVNIVDKYLVSKNNLVDFMNQRSIEIMATAGAGDVDKFVYLLENMLIKKCEI
ncbi:MAG: UDP-N-acetylmuramate--L-alanine ligase [Cytophagales bacterium]|nr:MAG: UDP-N-acetylmuramate--L-alanine ligase [Cytophagales bacterium]